MSVSPAQIAEVFPDWCPEGRSDLSLRFELDLGSHRIDRATSAWRRGVAVADAAFHSAEDLHLAVIVYGETGEEQSHMRQLITKELAACGLPRPDRLILPPRFSNPEDPEAGLVSAWAAPLAPDAIGRAIWARVAADQTLEPCVYSTRLHLFSLARGLLCHPYDDRGMDLIGQSVDVLRPFYDLFEDWLLDYDLPRMRRLFEG